MNQNIFDINWNTIVRWMLPLNIRKTEMFAWVKTLITPLVSTYRNFIRFKKAKAYELMITGQVCYLELMLNDAYDFVQKRIRVVDPIEVAPIYLFTDDELQSINLYTDGENINKWLFTDGEVGGELQNDFIVMVPADISFDVNEMRSMVFRKRLPGMRFTIQIF